MPVPRGSRFAGLPVFEVDAPDGTRRHVIGLRLTRVAEPGGAVHRVRQGEAADLIARAALGDELLWWRVLDANPLRYPLDLAPGDVLALPARGEATRADRSRSF